MRRCFEVLEVGDNREGRGVDPDNIEGRSTSTLGKRQGNEFAEITAQKRIGCRDPQREKDLAWVRPGANQTLWGGLDG